MEIGFILHFDERLTAMKVAKSSEAAIKWAADPYTWQAAVTEVRVADSCPALLAAKP